MSAFPIYSSEKSSVNYFIRHYRLFNILSTATFISIYLLINSMQFIQSYVPILIGFVLYSVALSVMYYYFTRGLKKMQKVGDMRMSKNMMYLSENNETKEILTKEIKHIAIKNKFKHPFKSDDCSYFLIEISKQKNERIGIFIKKSSNDEKFEFIKALSVFSKINKIKLLK